MQECVCVKVKDKETKSTLNVEAVTSKEKQTHLN